MNPVYLDGKIAVVTGAAKGIGRAVALVLAENGGVPVLVDCDAKALEEALEEIQRVCAKAKAYCVNVADTAAVRAMMDDAAATYGRLDVLVNNAGILDNTTPEELEEELWDRVLDINLKGAFFCSKYAYEHMKKQSSGRIINIASVAGQMGGYSVGCAYAASKGGIIAMTMNLARKAAPYGITVNAVAPGTIESDMAAEFTPEQMERLHTSIPIGRLGKPREIADAVLFLASDAAGFTTGAVVKVNGGMLMG